MSDHYRWTKLNERNDLDLFLAAYAEATGESLMVTEERETPDFLCERENGQRVGIELTKIIAHPETRQWHRIFGSGPLGCFGDIASGICKAASEKADKFRKGGWILPETILAIQLFDNPLSETYRELEQIDYDEYAESGFAEIWIADHSTIGAFGCVELFGIHPEQLAGYYNLTAGCKPYG